MKTFREWCEDNKLTEGLNTNTQKVYGSGNMITVQDQNGNRRRVNEDKWREMVKSGQFAGWEIVDERSAEQKDTDDEEFYRQHQHRLPRN